MFGIRRRELERTMKCPFCDSMMAPGKVSVEKSTFGEVVNVLGVITSGIPSQLYFG